MGGEWTNVHWNGKVVTVTTLYSLVALKVVVKTTSSAANDYKVDTVAIHSVSVYILLSHDDVIKRKHFPHYWPFLGESTGSPVDSPHKGHWTLMFSLICAWTNGWANHRDAGDLRRHRADYDVTVMISGMWTLSCPCCSVEARSQSTEEADPPSHKGTENWPERCRQTWCLHDLCFINTTTP